MKNTKAIKFIMFLSILVTTLIVIIGREEVRPVENLAIVVGSGYDIEKNTSGNVIYKIPRSTYTFEGTSSIINKVLTGISMTLGETRQDRQTKMDKLDIFGLDKVFVLSEETASYGIKPILDILFRNPAVNDNANLVVCKGQATTLLEFKIPGYPSSSDYIEGLIRSAEDYNFFSREYSLSDSFVRAGAEGRNLVLPYITLKKEEHTINQNIIEITGSALFKKYNMVTKLDMNETKIMNLLRENNARGMLKIQNGSKEFIEFYGKSKRKVRCSKENGKYKFTIDVTLKGNIVTNQLIKELNSNSVKKKEFEKTLAFGTEKSCNEFIDKMKNIYKVDCLELGRIAASKYGRRTGVNWDEIISKSDIKVNVKIQVDTQGRGHFI